MLNVLEHHKEEPGDLYPLCATERSAFLGDCIAHNDLSTHPFAIKSVPPPIESHASILIESFHLPTYDCRDHSAN